jgi:hypothetical protein
VWVPWVLVVISLLGLVIALVASLSGGGLVCLVGLVAGVALLARGLVLLRASERR